MYFLIDTTDKDEAYRADTKEELLALLKTFAIPISHIKIYQGTEVQLLVTLEGFINADN